MSEVSSERAAELEHNLADIKNRVITASQSNMHSPTLIAVSKYKPSSDIKICCENGQFDFGENYVQELVQKADSVSLSHTAPDGIELDTVLVQLPKEIRWHFIGHLQSNKVKSVASIPNLYALHTLSSTKTATLLQKALPIERPAALNVLLQVNTSGEDAKSGLPPLSSTTQHPESSELVQLALHIINSCPSLRLQGLMTIGSLEASLSADADGGNPDFNRLKESRDVLVSHLQDISIEKWGSPNGHLALSMGMSSDFEDALKAGSDLVRVGTGIFGSRKTKEEMKA